MSARSARTRSQTRNLCFASRFAWLGLVCALACSSPGEGTPTATGGASGSGPMPASGGSFITTGGTNTGGSLATNTGGTFVATGGVAQGGSSGSPPAMGGSAGGGGKAGSGGFGPQTGGSSGQGSGGAAGSVTGGAQSGGQATGGGSANGGSAGSAGNGGKGGAGGGGTAGAGGTGGASSYRPCPSNGDPCKILPLGDSITWGIQYDGAYRVELFNKAVAAKQKITFTGSLNNGPSMVAGVTFPKNNEGHSGWTIDQDAGLVPSPAFNTVPHIVLLHIGTNDIYAGSGQSTMPNRLGALMDKIIAAAPNALLVVAKITPLSNASWNATIKTYNDAMPALVASRVSAGKHVSLVDLNTGFTGLSSDGIHPNKTGYDWMAGVWYNAISGLLPQ